MANETQGTNANTAGPWTYERRNSGGESEQDNYFCIIAQNGTVIAETEFYNVESPEANAKLIAQAPAMAAALEHCIKALRNRKGYTTTDRAQIAVEHAREVLRDAGVLA
jgi:hypothetical protein